MDADLLKQLENSLISYQENQETLEIVVQSAQRTFGDDWMKMLPQAFDDSPMDEKTKTVLRDKANHAIHYHSALLAWQEAYSYLNDPASITAENLAERIPVLEYWLSLFGNEGTELTQKVKDLYVEIEAAEAEQKKNAPPEEEKKEEAEKNEVPASKQTTDAVEEEAIVPEEPAPIVAVEKAEVVEEKEPSVEQAAVEEKSAEETVINIVEEKPVEGKPTGETIVGAIEEKPVEEETAQNETVEEKVIEEKTIEEKIADLPETLEDQLAKTDLVEEEKTQEPVKPEEPVTIKDEVVKDDFIENEVIDEISEDEGALEENSIENEVVEEKSVLKEITKETPEEDETHQEEADKVTPWEDKNTDGDVALEDWIDLDSIPTAEPPVSPIREPKEPEKDPQFVSQNWDITAYLKQKELFDAANNWLSAWCIRMDKVEKTSYPYYGFIVDLMHDLKEKAQLVLENQLLEDSVEQDVPDGRVGMERVVEAIDKEFEMLPDDFKTSTAEKIRLNAREILGKIDTSTEREEIEKAPDGFELIDDPYETSTQQIIDDFEKTEREAQNKIDKLNVMEDNKK